MPAKNGRNVSLTDEQSEFIDQLVKSGRYASASEVVRDGLRLLQRDEEARLLEKWLTEGLTPAEAASIPPATLEHAREAIRSKIREGLDEALSGQLVDGVQFFNQRKTRLETAAASTTGNSRVKRRT